MRYLLFISFTVALLGCGDDTPAENNGTAPVDLSGFTGDLARVECERIFACCDGAERDRVFVGQTIENQADCEAAVTSSVDAFVIPKFEAAAEAGRIDVDSSAFGACNAALSQRDCSDFEPGRIEDFVSVGACDTAFAPVLETSGFCDEDFECLSGFCAKSGDAEDGSCAVPPAPGEPCVFSRCDDAGFCNTMDVCVEKLAQGETCPQSEACKTGFCTASDGSGTCEPPADICEG